MNSIEVVPLSLLLLLLFLHAPVQCQRWPASVNIGAVFTFDSVIGRPAKEAMEIAASDINRNPGILNGTKLNLLEEDAQCSVFMGSVGVFKVIEKEIMAIIGPLSSSIAHMMSPLANGLKVPQISYAATDPTLSSLQFPYFFRTTQSDFYQMAAMADLIESYRWKGIIAVFVDNDYGRNGISALENQLSTRIFHKLPLPSKYEKEDIVRVLNSSKLLGPRVYVVHICTDQGLRIFKVARQLHMMGSDYVWLATDWLSTTLDSSAHANPGHLKHLQGVIGLRQRIPESKEIKAFKSRWRKMQAKGKVHSELNDYAYYAYDTVWAVAHSIETLLKQGSNVTFSLNKNLQNVKATKTRLGDLRVFDDGGKLQKILLKTNFTGLTGSVQFTNDRNLVGGGYEVFNIVETKIRTIGYWSNASGLSASLLNNATKKKENLSYSSIVSHKLDHVIWPGGKTETPQGWLIATHERPLRVGVPTRVTFPDFVTEANISHKIQGYCIDVFLKASLRLPYKLHFKFHHIGDGQSNPNHDYLVRMVADNVYDAAVGDIAIVTSRTKIVDFTQPYIATGLVIVAPLGESKPSAWVFLKPFSSEMWAVTVSSFLIIGVVIWILEHRVNDDFRGPPKRQLVTIFMFSLSTPFKTYQEQTVSGLGRLVMVVWLFLLMVLTSSYMASLTAILTVQQLSSPSITGINSLIASGLPIGYRAESFVSEYLINNLGIRKKRLKPLGSPEEYEVSLRRGPYVEGGVAAIIDELPYGELFVSQHTDFTIVGSPFSRSGWGFAFQKDSPLAADMSTAILNLSQNGMLSKLHDKWFCKKGCASDRQKNLEPNQLHLSSFSGLFLLCGVFTLSAFLLFLMRNARKYIVYRRSMSRRRQIMNPSRPHSFIEFLDEKEEALQN